VSAIEDLEPNGEPPDEAGSLLLQLVAAVDYLRRGVRPGFTAWDAFEEALRWHIGIDEDWTVADPLGRATRLSFTSTGPSTAETFNVAIRRWAEATADVYNGGLSWEPWAARTIAITD
jgi:hypothetical protein